MLVGLNIEFLPSRYDRHMRMASTIANISLAYIDQDFLVTPNARLMYATGFPCWVRTAPISSLNASISIVKALLKLSMANEGVVFMACDKTKAMNN